MPTVLATPPRPAVTYTDSHTRACRRVGSQEVLDQILEYAQLVIDYEHRDTLVPEGWKKLGEGVSRMALLGPDGYVYKLPLAWSYNDISRAEAGFYELALRHRENRPHVPHFRTFEITLRRGGYREPGKVVVMAMERLVMDRERLRDDDTARERVERMAAHIGCFDAHGGNIGWRGNNPVLLDAGGGQGNWSPDGNSGCGECNPNHWNRKG